MARKTSDIAMLLSSRSKSRSRKGRGITGALVGMIDNLLGRKAKRGRRQMSSMRAMSVSAWVFAICVLVAFGGGFLVGGAFGTSGDGTDPLRAPGRSATFVGEFEIEPLSRDAFIVAAYPDDSAPAAKQHAINLTKYLQAKGFEKARPFLWPQGNKGPVWVVTVYYDGQAEAQATRDLLRNLPMDVPDQVFVHVRNVSKSDWPISYEIQ